MKIRWYRLGDELKIFKLIQAVYGKDICDIAIRRFEWQYLRNPQNLPGDPRILLLEDDEIVGMLGLFPQQVKIGSSVCRAYWGGDFMVHPGFRGRFNGLKIIEEIMAQPFFMIGFPSEETFCLWSRAGVKFGMELNEYSRANKFLVIRSLSGGRIDLMTQRLIRAYNKCICSIKEACPKLEREIKIVSINSFDERFDIFWKKISEKYQAIQVRDSNFLNWRFIDCPYIKYKILTAIRNNEIVGYVVLRVKKGEKINQGRIIDLFVDPDEKKVLVKLVDTAINYLQRSEADIIKFWVSNFNKDIPGLLFKNSFNLTEKKRGVFQNNSGNGQDFIIENPQNWHLTEADSDIDFSM